MPCTVRSAAAAARPAGSRTTATTRSPRRSARWPSDCLASAAPDAARPRRACNGRPMLAPRRSWTGGSVRARAIAPWLRKAWVGYRAASHRGRTKMRCLECGSQAVTERPERTAQGYRRFRCRACGKQFNERSGTLLNRTQYPSDVIALVVLWRLRYKLSLRDLPEMFAMRGIVFSYE